MSHEQIPDLNALDSDPNREPEQGWLISHDSSSDGEDDLSYWPTTKQNPNNNNNYTNNNPKNNTNNNNTNTPDPPPNSQRDVCNTRTIPHNIIERNQENTRINLPTNEKGEGNVKAGDRIWVYWKVFQWIHRLN